MLPSVSFASWAARSSGSALVPPALAHQLVELLALRGGNRFTHVQAKVDRGFLQREPRRADLLQLAVDRGAVRFLGREQIFQVDPLHFQVRPVANFRLAKLCNLLANLGRLLRRDAGLLPNLRVIQKTRQAELPASFAHSSPAHALASAKAFSPLAPSAASLAWASGPHWATWPHAIWTALLFGWLILRTALRHDWRAAKRQSQQSEACFRMNLHDEFSYTAWFADAMYNSHRPPEKFPNRVTPLEVLRNPPPINALDMANKKRNNGTRSEVSYVPSSSPFGAFLHHTAPPRSSPRCFLPSF